MVGLLALALSLQSAGQVFNQQATGDRLVVVEAESAGANVTVGSDVWTPQTSVTGFRGSSAMVCLPNDGTGANPGAGSRLEFRILFRATGTHYLWLRGRARDDTALTPSQPVGNNDSVFVRFNTGTVIQMDDFVATQWQWDRTNVAGGNVSFSVPSVGVHTITVYMREDGFLFDRFLITTNSAYSGVTDGGTQDGPAASGQIPDETPGAATPPTVVPGSFRLDVSWMPITNADYYKLERRVAPSGPWTLAFTGNALSFADDPRYETTTTFCYRVTGVNNDFGESAPSTPSCGMPQLPPPRVAGDNSEGFFEDNCACGASAAPPIWALGLLAPLLLALRRR